MDTSKVLGPINFQFTDPEDVKLYGERWYRYDEGDLVRMRARDLMDLEAALGMPVVNIMNGARLHSTLGDLGAAWLGVRAHDPELAGDFSEFNPLTLAITWREADEVDEGKAPEPAEDSAPPTTSAPTDTVILQTSPIVG
jgi:hypothetical protein